MPNEILRLSAADHRLPGRTCLIVTHRKAALEICDYCLHMAHGALTAHLAKNEKKTWKSIAPD